jgi:hypothetical protein
MRRLFILGGHFYCGGGASAILASRWTSVLLETGGFLGCAGGSAQNVCVQNHFFRNQK